MPKILIVDDDSALRKIYARYLAHAGFEVLEARNGEEALLHPQDEAIDVILLDLRMPVAGGFILQAALEHKHPSAKMIVSSCYELEFQKALIKNAEGYFNKSEGCAALLAKIHTVLSLDSDLDQVSAGH
jgi:DNA-binding response OmpR family regulator